MSFILDALKKSESDRQRQSGPALYEVKVAAPRSQLPYWAIGLIILLGINLVIVAWALLRRPSRAPEAPVAAMTAPASSMPVPPSPAAFATSPTQPYLPAGAVPPSSSPPGAVQAPPMGPAAGYPAPTGTSPAAGTQAPLPASGARPTDEGRPGADAAARSADAQGASRTAQEGAGEQGGNPDDYAPATEGPQSPGLGFHVRRGTEEGVPLYSQVATAPGSGIPELRLDMWAYDQKPENRFVLINMKRLREGDSLPDGVKVEAITPDGAVLSHNGTRFLLPRE